MAKVAEPAPEPEEEVAKVVAPKQAAAPAPSAAPAQLSEAADQAQAMEVAAAAAGGALSKEEIA